jgi:hypothetical protein
MVEPQSRSDEMSDDLSDERRAEMPPAATRGSRFKYPERHAARYEEERTPEEMARLELADDFVRAYGLGREDLMSILLNVRELIRGTPRFALSQEASRFLNDLARAVDDEALERRFAEEDEAAASEG